MGTTRSLSLNLVLVCVVFLFTFDNKFQASALSDESDGHEYTGDFAVEVLGGQDAADQVAREHGFLNNGPVSCLLSLQF